MKISATDKIKCRVINSILAHPKRHLLIALGLIIGLLPGLSLIGEDYTYRAWYHPQDPLLEQYDEFERKFGNDDTAVLVIYRQDGLYHPESLKLIQTLTNEIWQVNFISRVDSLANFDFVNIDQEDQIDIAPLLPEEVEDIDQEFIEDLKQKIQGHNLIEEVFISKDGKLSLIKAQVQPSFVQMPDNQIIADQLREIQKKYQDEKHQVSIGGTSVLMNYYKEIANQDLALLLPLLYFLFTVILIFIFRSKSGVLLPYVVLTSSIAMMMGCSGFLGSKLNSISAASPNILMTVAIADAVHILTVFYLALRKGLRKDMALRYSLDKNFFPTLLTSLTTIVGFLSFTTAKINAIATMGLEVAIGVAFAWYITYFLIAPLIQLLPLKSGVGREEKSLEEVDPRNLQLTEKTRQRVQRIYRFRYFIVSFSLLISLLGLGYSSLLEVNMDPYGQFRQSHPLVQTNQLILDHLGPTSVVEIMINAGETEDSAKEPEFLKRVEKFQEWLQQRSYIHKTNSIVDLIKELNQKLNNDNPEYYRIPDSNEEVAQALLFYSLGLPPGRELNNRISIKGDSVRLMATWSITRSIEANAEIKLISDKIKEFGLNGVVTGKMPLFHDLTPYIVSSFIPSFSFSLIAISLILIIVLGSLKLGLLALIPNIVPLLVGSAIYGIFHIDVDIASVLIASVVFGIAVDDSIHFLFEFRKLKNLGIGVMDNLGIIMQQTYPSLINTTLIIAIGFGSFFLADYVPNAKFGITVAVCLTLALAADLILMPAILMLSEPLTKGKT